LRKVFESGQNKSFAGKYEASHKRQARRSCDATSENDISLGHQPHSSPKDSPDEDIGDNSHVDLNKRRPGRCSGSRNVTKVGDEVVVRSMRDESQVKAVQKPQEKNQEFERRRVVIGLLVIYVGLNACDAVEDCSRKIAKKLGAQGVIEVESMGLKLGHG